MSCLIESNCFFLKSALSKEHLPKDDKGEFVFWGRSNVGKSSLLNFITKSKIAKTSKTPGRTRSLNFFEIDKKIRFVDFPGYGFARGSKKEISDWNHLIIHYLSTRKSLYSIFLLIDSRHGLKKIDLEAINLIESFGIHFFLVLTKIDKIDKNKIKKCYDEIKSFIKYKAGGDNQILMTSIQKKYGIKEIKKIILEKLK